jgi:hypothetical protein
MKYIVITSKHHDGFALFKSAVSAYNIVDATPFKRDVLKELADACARGGIRLGFYYSQSQDWHEPNGAGNTWDFGPDEKKDYDQYLRGKAEPQVRELLTNYGPVALIWFDTPRMMTGDRPQRFANIVRTLQPNTLIDGRLGSEGDYVSTGDNVIPPNVQGEAWEVPATINHTWGFRNDDTDWKGARPDRLQADRHRQQGRQLPAQRGADGGRRHPAGESGYLAHGGPLAGGQRRGGVRRVADALRRGAWRAERTRRERRTRRSARLPADTMARDGQARKALLHVLRRAAGAVSAAGHEESGFEGVSARGQGAGRDEDGKRPHRAEPRTADL